MNPNMSIYKRLNPRLLVQARVDLSLLYWANMSNISLTKKKLVAVEEESWYLLLLLLFFNRDLGKIGISK